MHHQFSEIKSCMQLRQSQQLYCSVYGRGARTNQDAGISAYVMENRGAAAFDDSLKLDQRTVFAFPALKY